MKSMRNLALAVLAGLALSLAPAGSDAARPQRTDSFAVPHVRVFDGLRVLHDATVSAPAAAAAPLPPPSPDPMRH
jgi:hypothetical protein